jgi:hypothetical protein
MSAEQMHIIDPQAPAFSVRISDYYLPQEPKLSELRAVVEPHLKGQRLERVRVLLPTHGYTDMFVGEFSADGSWPQNPIATTHYRRNWITHNPQAKAEDLPAIYGPAVLFLRRVWF